MGVTEGGIHWLDGLIFFGLCFGVWAVWRIIHAVMLHREIQKKIEHDCPYDWMKDEDEWEW